MAEMISEQVSSLPPQFAQQHQQQQQLPGKEEKISNASRCEERYAEIIAWVFQMCASVSWIISVVIYDSWEDGDIFHMLAASAWTVSNLLSLLQQQQQQQQQQQYTEVGAWFFQMCASISWIICIVIYDSWEDGDIVQMLAASAWTVSNLLSLLQQQQQQQQQQYAEVGAWFFQMCASISWIICVVIYDSWGVGDIFQMLAASAWTVSNLISIPYNSTFSSDGASQTEEAPSSGDDVELIVVNSV